MTNYQTTIQNIGAIRFGSVKLEVFDTEASEYIDIGAMKGVSATTNSSGEQKFAPDNAAPIINDPVPESWEWKADVLECWNAKMLKILFGEINTYTESENGTVIGVYAGKGKRPYNKIRITNTTAGEEPAVIELVKVKVTSDFDFTYPTDTDGTTSIALPITFKAEIKDDEGFGNMTIPDLS